MTHVNAKSGDRVWSQSRAGGRCRLVLASTLVILGAAWALAQAPDSQPAPPTPAARPAAGGGAERIRELIKERAKQAGKPETRPAPATRPALPPAPASAAPNRPGTRPPSPAAAPPPGSAGAASQPAGGCGSHGGAEAELVFPPPDQPQPKLTLDDPRREISIWRGEPHEFTWEVKNTGEGPLAIRLKGG